MAYLCRGLGSGGHVGHDGRGVVPGSGPASDLVQVRPGPASRPRQLVAEGHDPHGVLRKEGRVAFHILLVREKKMSGATNARGTNFRGKRLKKNELSGALAARFEARKI